MELLPVDSEERLEKAKKVWDRIAAKNEEIAKYLRDLDATLEKDNEDAYSDLSDPFSDMGESEFAKPANKKRMSKLESDTLLMSSFTPNFMRVQQEFLESANGRPSRIYKEELGTKSYDYLVDMPHEPDGNLKKLMQDMVNSCRLPSPPQTTEEQEQAAVAGRPPPRGGGSPDNKLMGKSPLGDFNETNSLSEVWRMLEAQSTSSNGFPVSPIGYNVFDDKRMSWLRRETPGTWSEHEASRKKCEDWLMDL